MERSDIDPVTKAACRLARSWARGDAPENGGAAKLRQQRLVKGQGVGLISIGFWPQAPSGEHARETPREAFEDTHDLGVVGGRERDEPHPRRIVGVEHAVYRKDMEVNI